MSVYASRIVNDISCHEANDGSITFINQSGGSGTYDYSIDGGTSWSSNPDFTDLTPGVYSLWIADKYDHGDYYIVNSAEVIHEPPPITIQLQPFNRSIDEDTNTTFMINASGDNLSYQWFVDTGGGFDPINGTHYAGVDTPILEIIGAPFSFNNNYYMCVVSNCSSINSNHAKLTVIPREPVLRTIGNNGTTINNNLLMY